MTHDQRILKLVFMDGFTSGNLKDNPYPTEADLYEVWEFGAYVNELLYTWNDAEQTVAA